MEWEIVEVIPQVEAVERLSPRFGRAGQQAVRRQLPGPTPAPLPAWQGLIIDIFA